jgi:tartrate dehydrogenase/decarboxylase/D-malate dehydrogenase
MKVYEIAVIPGDGVGTEVVPVGVRVLEATAEAHGGFRFQFQTFDWSCRYYVEHGTMMPDEGLKILRDFDAIYLGAVGWPALVPDHISLWGLLMPIRKQFEQYINLRPCQLLPGVKGPLRDRGPADIDFTCIRENSEGEYSNVGGRVHIGTAHEVALQTNVFSRFAVERVIRYAFELARERQRTGAKLRARPPKVTSCTKSNASPYTMVFWDEVFKEVASEYPDVQSEKWHVDALAARFVTHPHTLDVVVASNLFADILTDLGGALQGSLGMPASANINPERKYPSLFEPVHGSAPDIMGKQISNPMATVWAGGMMLDHLGHADAGNRVRDAVRAVAAAGVCLTPDLGGSARTDEVGAAIMAQLT